MTPLTPRQQLTLGLSLALLMLLTRSQHFADLHHLPEASWAVFFLAGVFLRPLWGFAGLCGLAALSDFVAIQYGGVPDFCITDAYALLAPTYGALWLAGRGYARLHRDTLATLPPLAGIALVSALIAELISSGGFYVFSGHFAEPSLAAFLPRLAAYFPADLGAMALYLGCAALLYGAWHTAQQAHPAPSSVSK